MMDKSCVREKLVGVDGGLQEVFLSLEQSPKAQVIQLARPDTTLAAARFDIAAYGGKGFWEFLRLGPDLHAIIVNALYPEPVTINVPGEDFIEFHFQLSGGLTLLEDADAIDVNQGTLLVWRQPRGYDIVERLDGQGKRGSSVTLYCRPSYLERCFGSVADNVGRDLREVLNPTIDRVHGIKAALYPALTRLVLDFAAEQQRTGMSLVCAEALATQIITEVLANTVLCPLTCSTVGQLSDRDMKCLQAAQQLIVAQHAPPPTIDAIARQVGLSATKLKLGFRTVFGQTIAEYATNLRMASAMDMLRKSDRPIAQVSAALGYEYQNSFTVAFRRHCGILPKDYRRDPLAHSYAQMRATA